MINQIVLKKYFPFLVLLSIILLITSVAIVTPTLAVSQKYFFSTVNVIQKTKFQNISQPSNMELTSKKAFTSVIVLPLLASQKITAPSLQITPEDGGKFSLPNNQGEVVLAPNTVTETAVISYTSVYSLPAAPDKWVHLGKPVELKAYAEATGIEITEFLSYTVEITLAYNPNDIPAGPDPRLASIAYWDENSARWVRMPTLHRKDGQGNPVLWTRTSHFKLFTILGVDTTIESRTRFDTRDKKPRFVVVLDPDKNVGCLQDGLGNCVKIEWNYNLHTVLQVKTLLEECGLIVNLTANDITGPAPAADNHQLTDDERAELISEGDIGITIAYNTATGGFVSAGSGGSESWFASGSMGSEDQNFVNTVLNSINARTGLPNRGIKTDGNWLLSSKLALLAPEKRYAQIEAAFLTFGIDRQRIDYDYGLDTTDYQSSRDTNFAFPIYMSLMTELGLTDCGGLCFPNRGLSINNTARLAPPVEITDPFFIDRGIKHGHDTEANESIYDSFIQIRGEENTTYPLSNTATITDSLSGTTTITNPVADTTNITEATQFPLTSTLYISGISQGTNGVVISPTDFVTTTSGYIPAPYTDTMGIGRILRPIEYMFVGGVFQLGAGLMPHLSDKAYTPEEMEALMAGSCQGMSFMTAAFCAKLYDPEILFGQLTPGDLADDGLFAAYLNYYQMIQVYLPGTDMNAVDFFEQTKTRMNDPEAWVTNPDLLRLTYCPPNSCDCWGHVVLPYMVFDVDDNTTEMFVYDPNYPQNNEIKVVLNKTTGTWTYKFNEEMAWTGTEVNILHLSDFPKYGESVEDFLGEDYMVSIDWADEYGRPRASYGADHGMLRIPYGRPRASYGEDGNKKRTGASFDSDGNLVCEDDMPQAKRLVFNLATFPGTDWLPPQVLLMPKKAYTFYYGQPRQSGIVAGTIYMDRAMYTFNGTGGYDTVKVSSDLGTITHTTTVEAKALSMSMYRENDTRTRIFGVSQTSLQAQEEITFRSGKEDNTFEYINKGKDKQYDISLIQVGTSGVGMFTEPDVTIEATDRHVISACSWDDLTHTIIFRQIDHGNDGTIDETDLLSPFPFLGDDTPDPSHISALAMYGHQHWFGTRSKGLKLYKTDTKTLTVYDTSNSGLPSNSINDVAVSPMGEIWVATNKGASRFDGTVWQTYTEADGLLDKLVSGVAVSPSGVVWFATNKGVSQYTNGSWTSYTKANGLPNQPIKAMAVDADESVWVATANGKIMHYEDGKWVEILHFPATNVDAMTALNGVIWFATNKGLVKYQEDAFTIITSEQVNLHEVADSQYSQTCRAGMIWTVSENGTLGIYDSDNDEWLIAPK